MGYAEDRSFADRFTPAIKRILGGLMIEEATEEEDTQHATDLVLVAKSGLRVGCRIRRSQYADKYPWEFTIRNSKASGAKTEAEKIFDDGWGDWLFYGFAEEHGAELQRWMVIDLSALRTHAATMPIKVMRAYDATFRVFDARYFPATPKILIDASHIDEYVCLHEELPVGFPLNA